MKGTIFNIQRCAIHDGPGIRTTVFLKGCPLSCWWCHNPEGRNFGPERLNGFPVGKEISTNALLDELQKDRVFYEESGGGVTFSGGEPFSQPDFLLEMMMRCREVKIHTVIDTCGYADLSVIKSVSEFADMFFFDLKIMDDQQHKKYTGVSNARILVNLEWLLKHNIEVSVRIPLIPGITNSKSNLEQIAKFLNPFCETVKISLIPFHTLAVNKYRKYNLLSPLNFEQFQPLELDKYSNLFKLKGFSINHE